MVDISKVNINRVDNLETKLNGKQSSLNAEQMLAVNSGINNTLVGKYNGYEATINSKQPKGDYAYKSSLTNYLPLSGGTVTGDINSSANISSKLLKTTANVDLGAKANKCAVIKDDGTICYRTIAELKKDLEIGGMPIGTIFPALYTDNFVPEGAVRANGAEYTADQFPSLWNEFLTSNPARLMTCTYSEFNNTVAKFGACTKWGIDTASRKFKVPNIGNGIFLECGNGEGFEAGLPNITGWIASGTWFEADRGQEGGALYRDHVNHGYKENNGGTNGDKTIFDASRSNSIYGKSATVQPKAITIRYYVQLVNNGSNQSLFDWSKYMTALDNKANKDLSNVDKSILLPPNADFVIERGGDDNKWFRKYKSGWLEQGGNHNYNNNTLRVTFHRPYKNGNYQVLVSINQNCENGCSAFNKNTTYFETRAGGGYFKQWFSCGWGA